MITIINEDHENPLSIPDGASMVVHEGSEIKVYFEDDHEVNDEWKCAHFKIFAQGMIKKQAGLMIVDGVISNGVKYETSREDQLNIMSASVLNSGARVSSVDEKVKLNPAQVNQLNTDMVARRESILDENDLRIASVKAAASEAEIQSIIDKKWTV